MAHEIGTFSVPFLLEKGKMLMNLSIGHALGLEHEHQRPDAAKYIEFDCRALHKYQEVRLLLLSSFSKQN